MRGQDLLTWVRSSERKPDLILREADCTAGRSEILLGAFPLGEGYWELRLTSYGRGGRGDLTSYWWEDEEPIFWAALPVKPNFPKKKKQPKVTP